MTHYEVLELPENASAADIRRAYRRLVLLTHPDRTPDPAAHARYLAINAAYETLSDPGRRAAYDFARQYTTAPPVPPTPPVSPGRARDQTRRAQQPRATTAPREAAYYLQYAPLARRVCKWLLAFCLLLAIDRLAVLTLSNERVVNTTSYSGRAGSFCWTITPSARLRGKCFNVGDLLEVRRTAIFRQVISVRYQQANDNSAEKDINSGFVYSRAGLLFVIALLCTSLAGVLPGNQSRRTVDCATMGALLAVIIMLLLAGF